jgi:hypothetical protein
VSPVTGGKHIPAKEVRAHDIHPKQRLRLGSHPPQKSDHWFYYEPERSGIYTDAALELLPLRATAGPALIANSSSTNAVSFSSNVQQDASPRRDAISTQSDAKFYNCSHDAVIRVYGVAGNVIEIATLGGGCARLF